MVIIKALKATGWKFGTAVPCHTLDTPAIARQKDPVERKAYLQCLLFLPDIIGKGLAALSSKEVPLYYSCVLKSCSPGDIPVGRDRKFYLALMNGLTEPEAALHGDGHGDIIMTHNKGSVMQSDEEEQTGSLDAEDPWHSAPIANAGGHEDPVTDDVLISHDGKPQQPDLTELVPGLAIRLDERLKPGQPGHYRRYVVRCPHAACRHKFAHPGRTCKKTRNIHVAQTKLGPYEPLAYLAVWARDAERHASADEHTKWRPSDEQVRAYMVEAGWLTS